MMRRVLTFVARFIAAICAILFVITALLALPLFNIGLHLFSPDLYKRALAEQKVYERLPAIAGEQIVYSITYNPCQENPESERCLAEGKAGEGEGESPDQGGLPPFLQNLAQKEYEGIIADLAPPQWLQARAESIIDQVFAYLDYESDPVLAISLVDLKERISGEDGLRVFMRLARVQPNCTPEQVEIIRSDVEATPEDLPLCEPPEPLAEKYAQKARQVLQTVAGDIPDETAVDLSTLGQEKGEAGTEAPTEKESPFGDDPRPIFQIVRWGMRLSPLVPVALLLLVTLFGVRSWKGWMQWWGIPFLIVGVIWGGLALATLPAMDWASKVYLADSMPPEFTPHFIAMGLDVGRYIVRTLATWIGTIAGLLGSLGLLLIAVSLFLKGKREPAPAYEPADEQAALPEG
jgi:hypothetical protein